MWSKIHLWLGLTQKEIRFVFILFLVWRGGLFSLGFVSDHMLTYQPSFPYASTLLPQFGLPRPLYSWANFDGVHYLTLATQDYGTVKLLEAFFPLFPRIILGTVWAVGGPQSNLLLSGLFITNAAALCMCEIWFALFKRLFSSRTARASLILLLLFPTSFFFGAFYTESLFLLFVLLTFFSASKKQFAIAAVFAFFASATRLVGIFLVPALIIELLSQKNKPKAAQVILILGSSLGLLLYMLFLHFRLGDGLAFFHVQSEFGAGRQTSLVLYPQVVYRYLRILFTVPVDLKYLIYIQEIVVGVCGLLSLLFAKKYVRLSWWVFSLCAFLLPTLTGSFSSLGRYILVCLPLFILGSHVLSTRKVAFVIWGVISGIILVFNTILFLQGYWVA